MSIEHMTPEEFNRLPGNAPKNKAPERGVKEAVCDWLDAHHIPWNRMNSGKVQIFNPHTRKVYWMQLCKTGTEDISAIWRGGRYLAIETKAPGKGLGKEQKRRQAEVRAAGGIYIKANSVDELALALSISL